MNASEGTGQITNAIGIQTNRTASATLITTFVIARPRTSTTAAIEMTTPRIIATPSWNSLSPPMAPDSICASRSSPGRSTSAALIEFTSATAFVKIIGQPMISSATPMLRVIPSSISVPLPRMKEIPETQ